MSTDAVRDHLYERLFQPWELPKSEWPLCREDWARVDAITALPWKGLVLDVGSGDGTLAAMVSSRNPLVDFVDCWDPDLAQRQRVLDRWVGRGWALNAMLSREAWAQNTHTYDGALLCEVLEHLTPEEGHQTLCDLHAVLKPGGMLCVTVPYEKSTRADYPGHQRGFDGERLQTDVEAAGFTVAHVDLIAWIWDAVVAYA